MVTKSKRNISYYLTYARIRGIKPWIFKYIAYMLQPFLWKICTLKNAVVLRASIILGYKVNVDNPITFNEKILHRKIYNNNKIAFIIADKWRVRKYVEDAGYKEILNELLCVTKDLKEIDFRLLPNSFVIKANYGYSLNVIVKDKRLINKREIYDECNNWMSGQKRFMKNNPEFHYAEIEPAIVVERYISDKNSEILQDYKIFCFHSVAKFIVVHTKLNGVHVTVIYDRDWCKMNFALYGKPIAIEIQRPRKLDKMLEIAERLSDGFDFLRVDLYYINDNDIIFGELTYNPGGGACRFYPKEYDAMYGKLL